MADLYDGKADERQIRPEAGESVMKATAASEPVRNLFRKRYRPLSDTEVLLHDMIKDKAEELAALFNRVQAMGDNSWERHDNIKRATTHLEDAVYRAVKALTG